MCAICEVRTQVHLTSACIQFRCSTCHWLTFEDSIALPMNFLSHSKGRKSFQERKGAGFCGQFTSQIKIFHRMSVWGKQGNCQTWYSFVLILVSVIVLWFAGLFCTHDTWTLFRCYIYACTAIHSIWSLDLSGYRSCAQIYFVNVYATSDYEIYMYIVNLH